MLAHSASLNNSRPIEGNAHPAILIFHVYYQARFVVSEKTWKILSFSTAPSCRMYAFVEAKQWWGNFLVEVKPNWETAAKISVIFRKISMQYLQFCIFNPQCIVKYFHQKNKWSLIILQNSKPCLKNFLNADHIPLCLVLDEYGWSILLINTP